MENHLYQTLSNLNIKFEKFEHEPIHTCKSAESFSATSKGAHCKTLFLRNKKKTEYYLAIVESHNRVNTKDLCKFLEQAGGKLSFGSPERLFEYLGLIPGSVTPFGLIYPNAGSISHVLIDAGIFKHDHVHFHPLRNTATLKIKTEDFKKFLGFLPHKKTIYEF